MPKDIAAAHYCSCLLVAVCVEQMDFVEKDFPFAHILALPILLVSLSNPSAGSLVIALVAFLLGACPLLHSLPVLLVPLDRIRNYEIPLHNADILEIGNFLSDVCASNSDTIPIDRLILCACRCPMPNMPGSGIDSVLFGT